MTALRQAATLVVAVMIGVAACSRSSRSSDEAVSAVLASPSRSAADRERDGRDHPRELLALTRFGPGMTIADVFGGGGYFAELLAAIVGPSGHVRLVNNSAYDREMGKDAAARLAGNRLPNVRYEIENPPEMKLGAATLDGAILVMAFHDLYFADPWRGWPAIDAGQFVDQLVAALRPGAALLVVDHAARPGSGSADAQKLHRIDEAFAVDTLTKHGLELTGSSDVLRNPADDHTLRVFDPQIRHHTDRFVKVFRKPK